ncbi:hypothetical protein OS493_037783 [Desmophyllum pertusum]|uniref:Rab-GAP TBC domain-containing protein n=1 Tax=Desmophyllum pertusum TaxID=174260 RepID=A0A9W9YHN0_9CNID|nr:hypothetical protein OS493_037783 [Desmophyllum pertusum]
MAAADGARVSLVSFYDRYGFAVYNPGSEFAEEDCRTHEYKKHSDEECSKSREFWTKMLENWEENQLFSPKQVRRFIKQGIPDDMRGKVWNKMIGSQAIKVISSFDYQPELVRSQIPLKLIALNYLRLHLRSLIDNNKENIIDSPDTAIMTRQWKKKLQKQISVFRQIMLDIDRSFPSHKMFIEGTSEGKEGRAALFRVLAVYAMYNPQVSYCQGMSLHRRHVSHEYGGRGECVCIADSFWCLVSMFERPKYLAGYFSDSLGKIQRHAAVFERLTRQRRTKLFKHLEAQGVLPLMYLTPWFMALFTSLPCWDAVLTIWDLLLLEAIWKVKPILKWEIDSIQAVIDEEQEKQAKRNKRTLNDHIVENSRKKQRTLSNEPSQDLTEPSFFQRVIGLFSSKDEPAVKFTTNDIEMTTFSVVSGQSPNVLMPAFCCSAASRVNTPNGRGSPRRSLGRSRRHKNKASRRRSNNAKDVLRRRHVVCQGTLGSPVRRSQRLAGRRTPVGVGAKGHSPNSLVRSSARNQHAFKMFNTPTPLRRSQVRPLRRQSPSSRASSPMSFMSPDLSTSPDVEMTSFELMEKRLDFTECVI